MAAETTTTLSDEMMDFYSSEFLKRDKDINVHAQGFAKNVHSKNKGKTITWNRYAALARVTTPLTEANNPSEVSFSTSVVTATLAEYGNTVKISKLVSMTSIDRNAAQKVDVIGQNKSETLDRLAREELFTGATVQFANAAANLAALAATDVMTALETRKAVRSLKKNKAMTYGDGMFLGKLGPDTEFDLFGDSVWQNAKIYSDVKELYRGEIGSLHKVRFLVPTDQKTEASTTTVASNFIHGAHAIGEYDLEGDMPKLYIKNPGKTDTSNPADRYSTLSWAGTYATKTLIGTWIINVKCGFTA